MFLAIERGAQNRDAYPLDLEVEDPAQKTQRCNQTPYRCVSLGNVKGGFLEGKQAESLRSLGKSEEFRVLDCP